MQKYKAEKPGQGLSSWREGGDSSFNTAVRVDHTRKVEVSEREIKSCNIWAKLFW